MTAVLSITFMITHEAPRPLTDRGTAARRCLLLLLLPPCALLSLLVERASRESALASLFISSPACAPGLTRYELRHVYTHVRT